MSRVTELLKEALEKQKKRFLLSAQEKNFIKDAEFILIEKLSDSTLIHNVRLKLNLLIDQFNSVGKQGGMLEDLISAILYCKIEVIKNTFESINVDVVEEFIDEKKFAEANRLLSMLFFGEVERISVDDTNRKNFLNIGVQLFTDEAQFPSEILEKIFTYLAQDADKKTNVEENLTNASLVCKQWNYIMRQSAFQNPINDFLWSSAMKIKAVITGSMASGISSLLMRAIEQRFDSDLPTTISVQFKDKKIRLKDNSKCILQLCEIGGWGIASEFASLFTEYFRGTNLFFLVFDLTSRETFLSLKKFINNIKSSSTGQDLRIILIGNKLDMIECREVSHDEASRFAGAQNMQGYFECSAKTGEGVDEVFEKATELAVAYQEKQDIVESSSSSTSTSMLRN